MAATVPPMSMRALLAVLCILAFGFQGFVAQTHVHDLAPMTASAAIKLMQQSKNLPLPSPLPDDSSKCPLCQLATALNAAIGVATTLIILPASGLAVLPDGTSQAVPKAAPLFIWRNRGPPQA